MSLSVAIVGAGPSGFYTAEALLKSGADCRIDIIERLPAPFGLVRYGVAPDHQSTKRVWRAFERTALNERVRYLGNVEVGRDVSPEELRDIYDAVIYAVGAPFDHRLGIPGEDKAGVLGSGAFVGWYNGHPDFRDLDPPLDTETVVVIGNGNVAIDVARVLVKTPEEMRASDIQDYAAHAIHAAPVKDVYMVGRRGPVEAKFTNVELREMGHLEACVSLVRSEQLPDGVAGELPDRQRRMVEKNLATLKEFAAASPDAKRKRVHFEFYAAPVEILGGDRAEGVRFERTHIEDGRAVGTGEHFEIPCGLVVTAIGNRSEPIPGVPFDTRRARIPNDDGRVAEGVYAVGWVMRGPTGVIGTNKHDADTVAAHVVEDLGEGAKPGRPALERLLAERGVRALSYDEWKVIDAAEVAEAPEGAPRRKLVTLDEMLAVLGRAGARREERSA